jgi:hypothetical protein
MLTIVFFPLLVLEGYLFMILMKRHVLFKGISFAAFSLMIFLTLSSVYFTLHFRHEHALLPDFGRWVSQQTEPHAVIIASEERLFIEYYGTRTTMGRPNGLFSIDPHQLENFRLETLEVLKSNPVYITGTAIWAYNPNNEFSNFIFQNFNVTCVGGSPIEDWHQGEVFHAVGMDYLFRIIQKHSQE